jgi:hypothetical protein
VFSIGAYSFQIRVFLDFRGNEQKKTLKNQKMGQKQIIVFENLERWLVALAGCHLLRDLA